MEIKIRINCEGDAFAGNAVPEVERILEDLAFNFGGMVDERDRDGYARLALRDTNGNECGEITLAGDLPR